MYQKTKKLLDQFGLHIFYGDGHAIFIKRDNRRMCEVDMSNCNDKKQLHAIVSAFLQGYLTD